MSGDEKFVEDILAGMRTRYAHHNEISRELKVMCA